MKMEELCAAVKPKRTPAEELARLYKTSTLALNEILSVDDLWLTEVIAQRCEHIRPSRGPTAYNAVSSLLLKKIQDVTGHPLDDLLEEIERT